MNDKTWLESLLGQEEHRQNEDLQRLVWKARHQRKLSDEDIAYFLQHCERWDMLPHYACYFRKTGRNAESALAALVQDFHLDANPKLVDYQTESGEPERCIYAVRYAKEKHRCDRCGGVIPAGQAYARLESLGADKGCDMHQECAWKNMRFVEEVN